MKSFIRWSATVGLVGTTLLGSLFGGNLKALALTEEQVIEKLRTVAVFLIAQENGIPVSQCVNPGTGQPISCDDEKRVVVTPAFMSPQDAQTALEQIKTRQPQEAQNLQVLPSSLAFVYQQLEEANRNQQQRLVVDFFPVQQQVNSAITLLQQNGQQVQQFNGVPLFVAVATVGDDKIFIPGQNGDQEVIPLFFDKQQLQDNLQELMAEHPELESKIQIEVMTLEDIINALETRNDPVLEKFVFEPSPEVLQFLQSRPSSAN